MKKFLMLSVAALFAVMLTGCGDSNIDAVKGGVLEDIDNTRTVEQMLSAKYKKLKWRSFTSDANQQVVEVTGVRAFSDKEKADFEEMEKALRKAQANQGSSCDDIAARALAEGITPLLALMPLDGDRIMIQFILSADGEHFDVGYCEVRDNSGELKKLKIGGAELTSTTESAYENGYKFIKSFVK